MENTYPAREYLVRWDIEVSAKSPREAAQFALGIMQDVDSLALLFQVGLVGSDEVEAVDLGDGEETCERCGEAFPSAGDGYDGLCPTCADLDEAEPEV